MKTPVLTNRKEVVKAVIAALPGKRIAAAAMLDLTLKQFDNHAYQNNNARPLTDVQLHQLEQRAGTTYLPEYVANLYGGLFVKVAQVEQLDNVELYAMSVRVSTSRGAVDEVIARALEDGSINKSEADEIMRAHNKNLAARHSEVLAAIALYSSRKQTVVMA